MYSRNAVFDHLRVVAEVEQPLEFLSQDPDGAVEIRFDFLEELE